MPPKFPALKVRPNKNALFIGGAVGMALIASIIAVKYVETQVDVRTKDTREMVEVAVPNQDLKMGARLSKSDLAVRPVPVDFVPADAVTPANVDEYVGRVLKADVRGGAPVSAAALVAAADQFSTVIPVGKVAYTLSVDENNSIAGMVAPGDLIDIFFLKDGEENQASGARLFPLLQMVKVLATGTRLGERIPAEGSQEENYSTVTLELDQRQAQQLTVAGKAGALRVVLRKNEDTSPSALSNLSERDLIRSLGGDPPAAPVRTESLPPVPTIPPAQVGPSVEFIIGGKS